MAPEGWAEGEAISSVGMSWSVVDTSSVDFREPSKMEMRGGWGAEH